MVEDGRWKMEDGREQIIKRISKYNCPLRKYDRSTNTG